MRATQLCTVAKLAATDILQLGNEPALYGVESIGRMSSAPDSPWRVSLRGLAGAGAVVLVRGGREHVLIVPRAAGAPA